MKLGHWHRRHCFACVAVPRRSTEGGSIRARRSQNGRRAGTRYPEGLVKMSQLTGHAFTPELSRRGYIMVGSTSWSSKPLVKVDTCRLTNVFAIKTCDYKVGAPNSSNNINSKTHVLFQSHVVFYHLNINDIILRQKFTPLIFKKKKSNLKPKG